MQDRRRRRGAAIHLVGLGLVSITLLVSFLSSAAVAWTAGVEYGPTTVYQFRPFDFEVKVYNNGSETLIIYEITLTIRWGSDPIFEGEEPKETHHIFEGEREIEPGETYTFENRVQSSFGGSFPAQVDILAMSTGEPSPTIRTYPFGIFLMQPSEEPTDPVCSTIILIAFFVGLALFFLLLRGPWGYEDVGTKLNEADAKVVLESVPKMAKLYPDEVIQKYWASRIKDIPTTKQNQYDKVSGILVATNQRLLLFELMASYGSTQVTASAQKVDYMALWADVHLEDIKSLHLGEGWKGTADMSIELLVKGEEAGYKLSRLFELDPHTLRPIGPADWKKMEFEMSALIEERTRHVEAGRYNEAAQTTDFSTLRERMLRMGIVLSTIRCPSCGGDVAAPLSGASVRCKYCGSEILAKQLLGKE